MADVRKDFLECSICLKIYTDPVILRCGHNFCRECIDRVLDTQEGSGVYSCPECQAGTVKRPALVRNITLCNIVETFPSPHPDPVSGISCTYCVDGSPVPAVKFCLLCEASLCDKHLRVHSKAPEHVLTDPTDSLRNKKCSIHREIIKYYCIQDATCICVSCRMNEDHKGHQVEMLDEAYEKKKQKLSNNLKELINEREETEKKIQSMQEKTRKIQIESAFVKERVASLVGDLGRQLDDLERSAQCDISRQEEQMSRSLSDSIHQLEIKKDALSRKMRHIEELCNTTDPLTVLQASDTPDSHETVGGDHKGGENTPRGKKGLNVTAISQTLGTLTNILTNIRRGVYAEWPAEILLDENTANECLYISYNRKTVTYSGSNGNRPQTPERFQKYLNVLSSNSFSSGRHYWDAECDDGSSWIIGMSYPSIERSGKLSGFGQNDKSWCLQRFNNYSVRHNNIEIQLPHNVSSNRVRVSLDYEAGKLSFYELSDPTRHLHTFTTTFTEPLHAAIAVYGSIFGGHFVRIMDKGRKR